MYLLVILALVGVGIVAIIGGKKIIAIKDVLDTVFDALDDKTLTKEEAQEIWEKMQKI